VTVRELPTLSFSTLACPEWSVDEVIARAAPLGYDGIEWRGGPDGHVSTHWSAARRRQIHEQMASARVRALAVTSYATFSSADPAERVANRNDLAEHVQLAADLGAPFVRTFLGWRSDGVSDEQLTTRLADGLRPLGDFAASLSVDVVIEPHDDFVYGRFVRRVLESLDHSSFGAVWDIGNAWAAGERPEKTFAELKPWIRYVQVKDGVGTGDGWRLTDLGKGEVPLAQALALAGVALPPVSVEWERAWHEELRPAAQALGPAARHMREILRAIRASGTNIGSW
jgi:sugar phosphate isomerase/epimerase